jgi:hypothetical protein
VSLRKRSDNLRILLNVKRCWLSIVILLVVLGVPAQFSLNATFAQQGTAPQEIQCPNKVDLSTGTDGGFAAKPVGYQEGSARWQLTSAPPNTVGIVAGSPLYSVDPAYWYSGNTYAPLTWATIPWVIPDTGVSPNPPNGGALLVE